MQTVREFYYKIGAGEKKKEGIGTFLGVFLPSLFTMIGALLYLPLGTTLGNFGILKTLFVLFFCLILTLITSLSLSSTASNMHVGEGGSYFMISRSFGLKIFSRNPPKCYFNNYALICSDIIFFIYNSCNQGSGCCFWPCITIYCIFFLWLLQRTFKWNSILPSTFFVLVCFCSFIPSINWNRSWSCAIGWFEKTKFFSFCRHTNFNPHRFSILFSNIYNFMEKSTWSLFKIWSRIY